MDALFSRSRRKKASGSVTNWLTDRTDRDGGEVLPLDRIAGMVRDAGY